MSALTPYIYPPYPDYAAEEAARPYEAPPVERVEAVAAVSPIQATGTGYPSVDGEIDAVTLSNATRSAGGAAPEEISPDRQQRVTVREPTDLTPGIRNNRAVRELLGSFSEYDNSAAVARYAAYLNMFANYGGAGPVPGETDPVAGLRAAENAAYSAFNLSFTVDTPRQVRENMSRAIDRWLAANGIFLPSMLGFPSSDGFRFSPFTVAARAALRAGDVLASYERARIAAYLREMAVLTPGDFIFYDPTGLGSLDLQRRREFLERMERILEEERIEARAAELEYRFDAEERLELDRLDVEEEERERLDRYLDEINTYYGQLRESVRQYDAGIVSAALSSRR